MCGGGGSSLLSTVSSVLLWWCSKLSVGADFVCCHHQVRTAKSISTLDFLTPAKSKLKAKIVHKTSLFRSIKFFCFFKNVQFSKVSVLNQIIFGFIEYFALISVC